VLVQRGRLIPKIFKLLLTGKTSEVDEGVCGWRQCHFTTDSMHVNDQSSVRTSRTAADQWCRPSVTVPRCRWPVASMTDRHGTTRHWPEASMTDSVDDHVSSVTSGVDDRMLLSWTGVVDNHVLLLRTIVGVDHMLLLMTSGGGGRWWWRMMMMDGDDHRRLLSLRPIAKITKSKAFKLGWNWRFFYFIFFFSESHKLSEPETDISQPIQRYRSSGNLSQSQHTPTELWAELKYHRCSCVKVLYIPRGEGGSAKTSKYLVAKSLKSRF